MPGKRSWPKATWDYPLPHDFTFAFGLGADATSTKTSTIIPYLMQDNAIVDYETIKVNPENADFAVVAKPNCGAGSYVPKVSVSWRMFSTSSEVTILNAHYMDIHTSMLNRLDAFDKKTGNDIETILELQHETTDEQAGPLYNGTKLFEGHHVNDLPAEVPFLTTTQQPEQVAFDMEMFFDAMHYYTNKEMLRQVTEPMKRITLGGHYSKDISVRERIFTYFNNVVPSMCKFMHPYTFCGGLFHLPKEATQNQYIISGGLTNVEHVTVLGRVRFNEYNPDYNRSRA